MPLTLADKKIAILVSNGFDEHQMTEIQRALTKLQAHIKVIAPEQGVVHGWQGADWGHYFNVDAPIGEALGSDFDMLVLPGGSRGAGKLKQNLHTRRIVNHFLEAGKPIAAIGEGVGLLTLSAASKGRTVAAADEEVAVLEAAGINLADEEQTIDENLLTAAGGDIASWVAASLEFFAEAEAIKRAA
jgi:protease I